MAAPRPPLYHPREGDAPVPYRTVFVEEPAAPSAFGAPRPTPFRVAERAAGEAALVILPGFGVSVDQIGADRLLWRGGRYRALVTHDAVTYRTSVDHLLSQYTRVLARLPAGPIDLLGLSLGGATALRLLQRLHQAGDPSYRRVRKLVTLVSAVHHEDFHPRWQKALGVMRELADPGLSGGEVSRRLRRTLLRAITRALEPRVRRSCLEADSSEELIGCLLHMVDTYDPLRPALPIAGLPGVVVTAAGIRGDSMVRNAQAQRFAAGPGRYVEFPGGHTPDFYAAAQDLYDALLLSELGPAAGGAPERG